MGWVGTQHPVMGWEKRQVWASLRLLSLTFMLTILGDGPGVSPTHRTLWDLGTRSQIQFAKTPQMVMKQTWV